MFKFEHRFSLSLSVSLHHHLLVWIYSVFFSSPPLFGFNEKHSVSCCLISHDKMLVLCCFKLSLFSVCATSKCTNLSLSTFEVKFFTSNNSVANDTNSLSKFFPYFFPHSCALRVYDNDTVSSITSTRKKCSPVLCHSMWSRRTKEDEKKKIEQKCFTGESIICTFCTICTGMFFCHFIVSIALPRFSETS